MGAEPVNHVNHFHFAVLPFYIIHVNLQSYVPYVCAAGSFAAMLGGLYAASITVTAGTSVGATLTAIQYVLLSHRPVPMATDGIVPIVAIPIAVVTVVAVSYSVIYQGSVLVLTELADQLGFQS